MGATQMKLLQAIALVAIILGQQPTEPYPGQGQHREPPAGWFCSPTAKDKAHTCHCKRMVNRLPPDPENNQPGDPDKEHDPLCEEAHVTEDKECTVYCHAQHCLCPVVCDAGTHPSHH